MHYYATKKWKKCGQCVHAKIMCPCHCFLPSTHPLPFSPNSKQFLLLLWMTGNTKSPTLATSMKLVKWMGIKMHYLINLTNSGKHGLFKNDCSNFGVLGLFKKKKNWYILSLWKVFFLQLADLHVVQSSRLLTLVYKKYSIVQFVHTTWIPIPHQICALSNHPNSHTKKSSCEMSVLQGNSHNAYI